jgi:hypothetical protein
VALGIVQAAQHAYNATNTGTPTIVWGSAPTPGNLLILVGAVRDNAGAPSAASGWTILASSADSAGTGMYISVYYKYAGASEPTSEKFDNTTTRDQWSVAGWEISGVTGTIGTDVVATHLNSSAAVNANLSYGATLVTANANEMVLWGVSFQRTTAVSYIIAANPSPPTITTDGLFNGTADGFGAIDSALGAHVANVPLSGTSVPWLVSAASSPGTYSEYGIIELQPAPSVTASGALGSNLTIGNMTAAATGTATGVATGALGSDLTIGNMTAIAVPNAVLKSSKVVGYGVEGPPDANLIVVKAVAGVIEGPPDSTILSPKVVAYAIEGPPPPPPVARVAAIVWHQ